MKVRIEITETELRNMISHYLSDQLGYYFSPKTDQVKIEVKSTKTSEWEAADFRAVFEISQP